MYCDVPYLQIMWLASLHCSKFFSSLFASSYWLSSAVKVTSNYMEDNIFVYSIFNLVTTLTIYITLAWHIHISIPKMNIEDKKIQTTKTPKSYFHRSKQYHKLWFCQVLVLANHKLVNCPPSSLNGPDLSWSWRSAGPECSFPMAQRSPCILSSPSLAGGAPRH